MADLDQKSILFMLDEEGRASHASANNAKTASHGFNHTHWCVIDTCGVEENIGLGKDPRDIFFRDLSRKLNSLLDADFGELFFGAFKAAVRLVGSNHVELDCWIFPE